MTLTKINSRKKYVQSTRKKNQKKSKRNTYNNRRAKKSFQKSKKKGGADTKEGLKISVTEGEVIKNYICQPADKASGSKQESQTELTFVVWLPSSTSKTGMDFEEWTCTLNEKRISLKKKKI